MFNWNGWLRPILAPLAMLFLIAIAARAIYILLAPLWPFLVAAAVLAVVYVLLFRGWRR
jgi:hypothetical protein